jgi:hypothetical protein
MTLQYKIDSIDDLSDDVKKMYTEKDGAYVLDVAGLEIPDVKGLKSALDKERDRANAAEKAARDAEKEAKAKEDAAARAAGDIETVEKNLREQFTGEIESRDQMIAARDAKLAKVLIRDEAHRIATEHAVDTDSVPLLSEWIEHRIGIEEKDGDFTVVVKGENMGLTIDEFVKKLPEQKALGRLIKSSSGTGGGAAANTGAGSANLKGDLGGSKAERIAAIESRFPDLKH